MKALKKEQLVEYICFEDFVQYGLDNSDNVVNGVPWSFSFHGYPVTHENDITYLISSKSGCVVFTPSDVLVIESNGDVYAQNIELFLRLYDLVEIIGEMIPCEESFANSILASRVIHEETPFCRCDCCRGS